MINKKYEMNCKTKQLQEVINFLKKELELALAEKRRQMKTKISSTDFSMKKLSTKMGVKTFSILIVLNEAQCSFDLRLFYLLIMYP